MLVPGNIDIQVMCFVTSCKTQAAYLHVQTQSSDQVFFVQNIGGGKYSIDRLPVAIEHVLAKGTTLDFSKEIAVVF